VILLAFTVSGSYSHSLALNLPTIHAEDMSRLVKVMAGKARRRITALKRVVFPTFLSLTRFFSSNMFNSDFGVFRQLEGFTA